jgi:heme-degrading monooxygenase HmoA
LHRARQLDQKFRVTVEMMGLVRVVAAAAGHDLEAKGAIGVQMLRKDHDDETEFMTNSYWKSA